MVEGVRNAEKALGKVHYGPTPLETKNIQFRRSLFVVQDIKAGEKLTPQNVRAIRPGFGLHTRHLPEILGQVAGKDIRRGTPLSWDMVLKNASEDSR